MAFSRSENKWSDRRGRWPPPALNQTEDRPVGRGQMRRCARRVGLPKALGGTTAGPGALPATCEKLQGLLMLLARLAATARGLTPPTVAGHRRPACPTPAYGLATSLEGFPTVGPGPPALRPAS